MFLDFAFSCTEIVNNFQIHCPCNVCANWWSMELDYDKQQLYYNKFLPCYYIWTLIVRVYRPDLVMNIEAKVQLYWIII